MQVEGDGAGQLTERTRAGQSLTERQWRAAVAPERFRALVAGLPGLAGAPEHPARTGVPGESQVTLVVTSTDGTGWQRVKWGGDPVPGFDEVERVMVEIANALRDGKR